MTAKTARRFRTAIMIMMVCVPVVLGYEFMSDGRITIIGLADGIALAMPLALLEDSTFDERMRRLPFSVALLAKAITYIGCVIAVFPAVGLVFGFLHRRPDSRRVCPARSAARFVGRPLPPLGSS